MTNTFFEDSLSQTLTLHPNSALPDVVRSLIQKMAVLEQKNAELTRQNEKLKEKEENLKSDMELQQYIIDDLKDDLMIKNAELSQCECEIAGQLQKAFEDLCKVLKFKGNINQITKADIAHYQSLIIDEGKYIQTAIDNGFLLFNYIEDLNLMQ